MPHEEEGGLPSLTPTATVPQIHSGGNPPHPHTPHVTHATYTPDTFTYSPQHTSHHTCVTHHTHFPQVTRHTRHAHTIHDTADSVCTYHTTHTHTPHTSHTRDTTHHTPTCHTCHTLYMPHPTRTHDTHPIPHMPLTPYTRHMPHTTHVHTHDTPHTTHDTHHATPARSITGSGWHPGKGSVALGPEGGIAVLSPGLSLHIPPSTPPSSITTTSPAPTLLPRALMGNSAPPQGPEGSTPATAWGSRPHDSWRALAPELALSSGLPKSEVMAMRTAGALCGGPARLVTSQLQAQPRGQTSLAPIPSQHFLQEGANYPWPPRSTG